MWKLILENPLHAEYFGKAMLVLTPICLVLVGIVSFKVLRYTFKFAWQTLKWYRWY